MKVIFEKLFPDKERVIYQKTTKYNKIKVIENTERRKLILDDSGNTHSLFFKDKRVLTGSYWDICAILPLIFSKEDDSFLILGGGGGTISRIIKCLGQKNIKIFSVDIDIEVFKAGMRYFDMPKHNFVVADFINFLSFSKRKFSHIIIDVFSDASLPSVVFENQTYKLLNEKAEKTTTINTTSPVDSLYIKEMLQRFFGYVKVVKNPESANYIIFASKENLDSEKIQEKMEKMRRFFSEKSEFTEKDINILKGLFLNIEKSLTSNL